jgi:peptide/nickel transport system permease protein
VLRFILKRLIYGFLVLFGVVTIIFLLFNLKPGDPARMMGGQHATPEAIDAIRKDLGLDLPFHQQYFQYLNDISFISIHNVTDSKNRSYLYGSNYMDRNSSGDLSPTFLELFKLGNENMLVIKKPYLRRSYQKKKKVSEIIAESLPGTVVLAVTAMLIATIFGIILGVFSALNKDGFFDQAFFVGAVLGMSGPSFFTALIIGWIGASLWYHNVLIPVLPVIAILAGIFYALVLKKTKKSGLNKSNPELFGEYALKGLGIGLGTWLLGVIINGLSSGEIIPFIHSYITLPGTNLNNAGSLYATSDYGEEYLELKNLILPALTLGIRPLAIILQLTRNSMLDVLSQDYIRTAKAKGLSSFKVVYKHALKNALNPVVTAVSGWFASLLAGAIFIEYVFTWKGLGFEVFNALEKDDFPVVMGAVLIIATAFVLINILVDIIYGILDPRVRAK